MIDLSQLTLSEIKDHLYNVIPNKQDDICVEKDIIKQRLIHNPYIIHLLDNKTIQGSGGTPDDYLGTNIYEHLYVEDTQDTSLNLICFELETIDDYEYNSKLKQKQLTFMVLVNKTNLKTDYGNERHDLMSYLIRESFNWSNCLGMQIHETYNGVQTLNNGYYVRTIRFESIGTNNLVYGSRNIYDS